MRSTLAASMLADLLACPRELRRELMADLAPADLAAVLAESEQEHGTAWMCWRDDPVGFAEDVLGDSLWSKQREILESLLTHRRVIVPAAQGCGKTMVAARALVWTVCTNPVGSATAVTIATRMRQVQRQMWPHIRKLHARAELPGRVDMAQWMIPDRHGVEFPAAYGFSPPDMDEAALQGIHNSHVLLVVDEAGGITETLGRATRSLLAGGEAQMLVIGNPPTDDEGGWFEHISEAGAAGEAGDITIRIPASDSPAITGERTGPCRDCPTGVPEHAVATHLVNQQWVDEVVRENGAEDPFVVAKVHARFPQGGTGRCIPRAWIDRAADWPDPGHRPGDQVRLGVDVAADGGDELVVALLVGERVTIEHTSSGPANASSLDVAGVVLAQILAAEQVAAVLGSGKVRVKIDAIGVGWGVVSVLKAWGAEEIHHSEIVSVVVSEKPGRPDDQTYRPKNQRAEMWLTTRSLLSPRGDEAPGLLLGALDTRTLAQLAAPGMHTDSAGYTVIEPKKDIRKRTKRSPDRAEAVLLAAFAPTRHRKGRLLVS